MQISRSLKTMLVSGVTVSSLIVPCSVKVNGTAPISSIASSVISPASSAISPAPTPTNGPGSSVPVGSAIRSCTVPGTFALTFDDGPFSFTDHVLDLLKAAGVKATFFVNGQNWGDINDYKPTVERILAEGHQLGSHTNRHPDLTTQSDAEIIDDMTTLENTLISLVGRFPTYMRPPFFAYNDETLSVLGALGYHVIDADLDTNDWRYNNLGNETAVGIFEQGLAAGGTIALAHDVHQNTAEVLVPEFLRILATTNLTAVPVGKCLGDPEENWYSTTRTATPTATGVPTTISITSTVTPTGVIGPDGACGGDQGFVCLAGTCCSQFNFCGTSRDHCGTGCQNAFGVCA
ncbi:peptidoglycan-N-acetylglucosamine deacetylase like protein [Verticillium longisporum]|uniref:Peptidoglycan-N-acetylglucosamine deacetylase like protein n=1 Tax=Verticillium longisporum TaxID=100787 RepID=A0A8I2ZMR9_VERLO|nr:peptidoglycan-N-acetylglucosamine deacetylase like protein [Verticillium longisporum]KAG7135097.1 peptidoglycan-N-acetylglucosamine deacetylase like protein [Verticillium longisporum]